MVTWSYRDSHGATGDLVGLFHQALQQCNLESHERLMVYSDHHTAQHYAAAFVAAAQQIGSDVFQIIVPSNQSEILDGPILDVWCSVDMVVDLESIHTSIYRPLRTTALDSGIRVLRVTEPEDVLFRLRPDPAVRDRTRCAKSLVEAADNFRVVSRMGTDIVVNRTDRKATALWGAPDRPGTWDHWSVGLVVDGANRAGTNGTIVMEVGDFNLGMQRYVASRTTITVEEGVIVEIEGGLDASLLRAWFEKWEDPRAYHISHIGWGCDPRADWARMAQKGPGGVGDAESFAGVFQIAFGRDTSWYLEGGTNDVPAHIDFNCLHHSISLDDKPITQDGKFVADEMQ